MMLKKWICPIVLAGSLFLFSAAEAKRESQPSVVENNTFGIINVPTANLRETPAHSAQLSDQEIMGYSVQLLKCQNNWYEVQTEYGYVGWMTNKSFFRTDSAGMKQWADCRKVMVSKIFAIVYSQPDEQSVPVTNAVLNVLLRRVKQVNAEWLEVRTPDGRTGFLRSDSVVDVPMKKLSGEQLRIALVKTAKSMMGTPYLWGGKSSAACDCSGFTQTIFRANGIGLLRDSRQQATMGAAVDYDPNFSNVRAGDLLFFGSERITHVGMSLGGAEFIHQSGDVHINSLDPNATNYSPLHRKILKSIRRIKDTD